jgi:predicted RNA-binding protein with PUA domain
MTCMILNTSAALQYTMPIISKKKYTFWCQDCNAVFDELAEANEHQEKEKHSMNQTEYFASC